MSENALQRSQTWSENAAARSQRRWESVTGNEALPSRAEMDAPRSPPAPFFPTRRPAHLQNVSQKNASRDYFR